ncbi:hypothetical protein, partial [Akkermansia sp.]|uniref:hypothetical protein n=1 Tax=Akkermansia sp. TaxID=1872421 RepID=UPI00266CF0A1
DDGFFGRSFTDFDVEPNDRLCLYLQVAMFSWLILRGSHFRQSQACFIKDWPVEWEPFSFSGDDGE